MWGLGNSNLFSATCFEHVLLDLVPPMVSYIYITLGLQPKSPFEHPVLAPWAPSNLLFSMLSSNDYFLKWGGGIISAQVLYLIQGHGKLLSTFLLSPTCCRRFKFLIHVVKAPTHSLS